MYKLTQTAMSTYMDCPFKFKVRYIDRLVPVVEKTSLFIGRLFHLYREAGWDAVEEEFATFMPSDQDEADQKEITWAILQGMASIAPDEPEVMREFEWDNELPNPDTSGKSLSFRMGGKADGLKKLDVNITGNDYALIEEKTRGSAIRESDIQKLSVDFQVQNAIVNIEACTDYKIREVWYRYFRKPSIRQKQNETLDQYCERVVEDYRERPDFYYHEERLIFPRPQLEAFKRNLWQLSKSILWTKNHDLWYRNPSHCSDWGGCVYLPICRGEDVTGLYKEREVNPELENGGSNDFFAQGEE